MLNAGVIYILGAGIAGLTLAEALREKKALYKIFEKEGQVGVYASGKNAGMLRTYDTDTVLKAFTLKSLEYYRSKEPSYVECGMILKPWEIDYEEKAVAERAFSHNRFKGLFLPHNGILEPKDVLARLVTTVGSIEYNSPTQLIVGDKKNIAAIKVVDKEIQLEKEDVVVVAAGEGAVALSHETNSVLELVAYRRTLYEFENTTKQNGPIEWDEEASVYFRPSGKGKTLTATAGEQIPVEALSQIDEVDDEKAFRIFEREFPFLNRENLINKRTCRRLTPLDNRPFVGKDAALGNLYWFTGLGGRGMSVSPGIAPLLANLLLGSKESGLLTPFAPGRVI